MTKQDDPAATAYYDQFRQRLIHVRLELDWTQEVMAQALGIPLANYKKYEIRSKFPLHLIPKLAIVTHRDVDFIVTGRTPSSPRVIRSRVA
jgi:transcriptional regulator with XRE-family HTH domain